MNTAVIVLIWLVAIGVGLWILSAILGGICAALTFRRIKKEMGQFDDIFKNFPNFPKDLK